jgi:hypothetical protein
MRTTEQELKIENVFRRFADSDSKTKNWDELDEAISMLGWLDDNQLTIEVHTKLIHQTSGSPRCNSDHPIAECFVPDIVEAIDLLLNEYVDTRYLSNKAKFMMQYYLGLSQIGHIVS